jgi:hypothetical protein
MFMLKRFGTAVGAAALLAALGGVSSASAANWDPANTTVTAHGTLTLTSAGSTVTCTYHSGVRSAGGTDAFTTETGGVAGAPPTFSGCTSSLPITPDVHASAPWTLTATSTTSVDVTNGNAVITGTAFGVVVCTITASGVSVANNTWNNATHTLTANSGAPFNVTWAGPVCPVSGVQSGTMSGSVVAPLASIT